MNNIGNIKTFTDSLKPALLALSGLCLCINAHAQSSGDIDSSATSAGDQRLETVIVTARRQAQPLSEAQASVTALGGKDLEQTLAVHPSQQFDMIPGTLISRGSQRESLTGIRSAVLTGAGACGAFLVSEDNIPLYANGFCNINQLFAADLNTASSLEVRRGPQSSLFGSNALFGAINVESFALPEPGENTATLQQNSDYATSFHARAGNPAQTLGVAASILHDTGYREDSGADQQFLALKHRHDSGNRNVTSYLAAMNLEQETAGYIQGQDAYKDPAVNRSNPNPEAYRDVQLVRGYSRVRWQTSDREVSLTPYFRHNNMAFLMHFLPWAPVEKNRHSSVGLQAQYSFSRGGSDFLLGSDLEYTQGFLHEYQTDPAPFNQPAFPTGDHYRYDVDALAGSVFAEVQHTLSDSWQLTGAVRADSMVYDYNNQLEPGYDCAPSVSGCRFYRPADDKVQYSNLSPSASLRYLISDTTHVYAKLSQGFRAPQATELFRSQSASQGELDPVTNRAFEVGLRGSRQAFQYAVNAYVMRVEDDIIQNADRRLSNDARTRHRGLEYEFRWQFARRWQLKAAGNFARHTYANTPGENIFSVDIEGNRIDTAPSAQHALELRWQPLTDVSVALAGQKLGSYYTEPLNEQEYPGHTLWHLRSEWQLDRMTLRLNINNLTDEVYANRADYAFGEARYFPGMERRLAASVSWKW